MTDRTPVKTKDLDRYGYDPLPWDRPNDVLAAGSQGSGITHFLGTIRPDGRPYGAGVGAIWLEGDLYFTSGPGTRKARNLEVRPAWTISARLDGIDLVFEGEASRVTDKATLERAAAVYREGGWPAELSEDAFIGPYNAPSAGPPPWHLFRFQFHTVFGVGTAEPYGATRWRFND
jgi:pyridoxamine 5'-phosphate oxidase-like protein